MLEKLKNIFLKLFSHKHSPHKLAFSCACGMYIAFSPYPGFHTFLIIAVSYFFTLHFPLVFAVASLNNPWTMIPIYLFDYEVGGWFVRNYMCYNPGWTVSLSKIFGSGTIDLWAFFIGGNILGIFVAVIVYVLMRSYDLYFNRKKNLEL